MATPGLNPDAFRFPIVCPVCKVLRGATCSREKLAGDAPVIVYCIACDHSWALTDEQKEMARKRADGREPPHIPD
jgi:hypothetical protein